MRLYRYIGPKRIADRATPTPSGAPICSPADVAQWVRTDGQQLDRDGCVIATFVVDAAGVLLIADRHSEHVACAGRQSVRSAGEITFRITRTITVVAVSNQSTGYCPEPESWVSVAASLSAAGLEPSVGFTIPCVFRRCPDCENTNLVKGGVLECGVCGADLPAVYNCQMPESGCAPGWCERVIAALIHEPGDSVPFARRPGVRTPGYGRPPFQGSEEPLLKPWKGERS